MKQFFRIGFVVLAGTLLVALPLASAQTVDQPSGGGVRPQPSGGGITIDIPNFLGFQNIIEVINAVIPKLITLATAFVAPMVLWAAYMLLFSPANPDLVKKAKTTLLWTLVGYAIILVGSGIAYIVREILTVPAGG